MSTHTPGPWTLKYAHCGDVGIKADGGLIAECFCDIRRADEHSTAEAGANARLIAAAPDLLAALQGMCSVWVTVCNSKGWEPEHMSQYTDARAAIAKAKGEA